MTLSEAEAEIWARLTRRTEFSGSRPGHFVALTHIPGPLSPHPTPAQAVTPTLVCFL